MTFVQSISDLCFVVLSTSLLGRHLAQMVRGGQPKRPWS